MSQRNCRLWLHYNYMLMENVIKQYWFKIDWISPGELARTKGIGEQQFDESDGKNSVTRKVAKKTSIWISKVKRARERTFSWIKFQFFTLFNIIIKHWLLLYSIQRIKYYLNETHCQKNMKREREKSIGFGRNVSPWGINLHA